LSRPVEEILLEGEIEVVGRLVAASNATLFGRVSDGGAQLPIIYKPVAGERPLWDFPSGTLAAREVASFKVSEALNWDLVPPTFLRDGPFGSGMVQQWIEIDESIDLLELVARGHQDLRRMVLFDAVINNTDRKFGHLLATGDGRVRGCDHGVTFHVQDKLRTVLWQWSGEPIPEDDLRDLGEIADSLATGELHEALASLLEPEEIKVTIDRLARLLADGRYPAPSADWPAVPWPPF